MIAWCCPRDCDSSAARATWSVRCRTGDARARVGVRIRQVFADVLERCAIATHIRRDRNR